MNLFHNVFSLYLISIAFFSICMDTPKDLLKTDLVKTKPNNKEKKANHLTDNDIQEIFDEVKQAKESNDSQKINDCIKLLKSLFEQNIDKKGISFIQEQIRELEIALDLLKKNGPITESMILQDEIFKQLNESAKTKEEAEFLAKKKEEEEQKTKILIKQLISLTKEREKAVISDEEKIHELEKNLAKAKEELNVKHKELSKIKENLKKVEQESGIDIYKLNAESEENKKDTDSKAESQESSCILF